VNHLKPPALLDSNTFDLIYAFSVLTHLSVDLQKEWLAEFRRLLRPGGILIFSTHGEFYRRKLWKDERAQFDSGECVVRFQSVSGSNLCSTYHPEAFARTQLATGWEVAAFIAEGAYGNPHQDIYALRKPLPLTA
jgi:SAM-dependent methyltransferase